MTIYPIDVYLEDNIWVINIPTLDGVTQAYKWNEIPLMAKEFISLTTDIPENEIELEVKNISIDNTNIISEALQARKVAQEASIKAGDLTVNAVRALRKKGLSLSETGAVLGVSHQRVSQLLNA